MPESGRVPIDAVVFDYGEVIAESDKEDWAKLVQIANIAGPVFSEVYWKNRLDYDRGHSAQQYWTKVASDAGTYFTPDQLRELIKMDARHWMHVNQDVLDWIWRIQDIGKLIAIISNMPFGLVPFLRHEFTWLGRFDATLFSCEIGVCKPEPEIYRILLRELHRPPERILFIDDKAYNVAGARSLGMHGLVFHSLAELAEQLSPFDVAAPQLSTAE